MLTSVLVIDDDNLIHQLIDATLSEHYQVAHAYDGEQGIQITTDTRPDIILLDVEMPGIDGFEVCTQLKQQLDTNEIPIMFLSSRSSLEERIKGYNAGADDYIVKPFDTEELEARIKVLNQYKMLSQSLKQDVEQAQNTAAIAMTEYIDMGRAVRFVSQTYGVHSSSRLSNCLFEFFSPLNLQVVAAFWFASGNEFFSNNGAVCPIEKDLMLNAKDGGRFIDFGARTIINYPNVSLLVKNMPVDDLQLYGRYKDLFPYILEATNAKLGTLAFHNQLSEQDRQITKTFELVGNTLRTQLNSLYRNNKKSVELIETLRQRFCNSVSQLALESGQEKYILDSIEETVENLHQHLTLGDDIQASVNEVVAFTDHIMKEREKILRELEQEQQKEESSEDAPRDDFELF